MNSVARGFEHQVKGKQKHKNITTGENDASDPSCPHVVVIVPRSDDVERILCTSSQHARVTVTRAEEVGKLEYAGQDDPEGVASSGKCS